MTPLLNLMQALAALVVVVVVVWFARRALARGSLFARRSAHMQVEDRLAIDLRSALVIVRVEERRLLLSLSDHGPAQLLAELSRAPGAALGEPRNEQELEAKPRPQ